MGSGSELETDLSGFESHIPNATEIPCWVFLIDIYLQLDNVCRNTQKEIGMTHTGGILRLFFLLLCFTFLLCFEEILCVIHNEALESFGLGKEAHLFIGGRGGKRCQVAAELQ